LEVSQVLVTVKKFRQVFGDFYNYAARFSTGKRKFSQVLLFGEYIYYYNILKRGFTNHLIPWKAPKFSKKIKTKN
jgi:hypothetical protein